MSSDELDNAKMEIPVSEIPPGPSAIKTEPKEECEESLSAFLVGQGVDSPPPVKIEKDEIGDSIEEYGTLEEDYTVDIKKLKTEYSEDSKEWINNPLVKSEEIDDQDDNFTENIKSEEMHIKEDDGVNEPGMSSNCCLPNNEDNTKDECTPATKTEFHCHKFQYITILEPNLKSRLLLDHKTLKCNECTFETDCNHDLHDHLIKHMASRGSTFSCYQCNFETRKAGQLRAHLRHYCRKGEMYRCDKCNYTTTLKNRFTRHSLVHKGHKEGEVFKCSKCEYRSHRKNNFQQHLVRHSKSNDVTS